jgi:hypothetical protein
VRTARRIRQLGVALEAIVSDGGFFDLLLHVDPDTYEQLPGVRETLEPDGDGGLVFAKDIHLAGGTVTVETSYERVAA